jgi:type II secretory pathway component PulK
MRMFRGKNFSPRLHDRRRLQRRGAILIVAMVTCATLAGVVLALSHTMAIEAIAAANQAARSQASAIELGGEQYVIGAITDQNTAVMQLTDDQFDAIPCGDGYFWVLRPQTDDASLPTFGLVDESSKLNINYASYNALLQLPGMSDQPDVAASIINWRNTNGQTQPLGATNDFYQSQPDPYYMKGYLFPQNPQYETVEELLLVSGVTPQILYGDGTAPPLGQANSSIGSVGMSTSGDVEISRGLYSLLTIYSQEPATAPNGGGQRQNVRTITAGGRNGGGNLATIRNFLTQQLGHSVNVFPGTYNDLFQFYTRTGMSSDDFSKVFDQLAVPSATGGAANTPIYGRINVNTAPPEVLACINNGLSSADVQKIVAARAANNGDPAAPIGWLVKALGADVNQLGNAVTDQPSRYSADILAVSGNGRAFKRVRVVIDASGQTPQIIYRRDITDRGWPMDPQLLTTIRAGQFTGNDQVVQGVQ